jgi:hypothetical protein
VSWHRYWRGNRGRERSVPSKGKTSVRWVNSNCRKSQRPLVRRNKNCLGSFQVLWNKNCTTENEEIMMEKLI